MKKCPNCNEVTMSILNLIGMGLLRLEVCCKNCRSKITAGKVSLIALVGLPSLAYLVGSGWISFFVVLLLAFAVSIVFSINKLKIEGKATKYRGNTEKNS